MSQLFYSDRIFVITDAHPSHSQLLLRSAKDEIFSRNKDILFKGVTDVAVPWRFEGLSIEVLEEDRLCTLVLLSNGGLGRGVPIRNRIDSARIVYAFQC